MSVVLEMWVSLDGEWHSVPLGGGTGGGGTGGGASALDDLTDVDTTGAVDGQVLGFDGTNWGPIDPPAGGASALDDLTDVDVADAAPGSFLGLPGERWQWVGLPMSATGDHSYATAMHAWDDKATTSYNGGGGRPMNTATFPVAITVDRIVVKGDVPPADLDKLEASLDGTTWFTVLDPFTPSASGYIHDLPTPVTAKFWRFSMGGWHHVNVTMFRDVGATWRPVQLPVPDPPITRLADLDDVSVAGATQNVVLGLPVGDRWQWVGAPAVATGDNAYGTGMHAWDGNPDTSWSPGGGAVTTMATFNEVVGVDRITVREDGPGEIRGALEVSMDGSTWTTVIDPVPSAPGVDGLTTALASTVRGKYWRLVGAGWTGIWIKMERDVGGVWQAIPMPASGASALDTLTDVSAPANTPAGKVLGTTAQGVWGPIDDSVTVAHAAPTESPARDGLLWVASDAGAFKAATGLFASLDGAWHEVPLGGGGAANPWVQFVDDPLTSLAGLDVGAAGVWSIDNGQVKAEWPARAQMRAQSKTKMPEGSDAYCIQVEFQVPATGFNADDDHIGIGFLKGDTTGEFVCVARGSYGDTLQYLVDGLAWRASRRTGINWVPGAWVTLTAMYTPATTVWRFWRDGETVATSPSHVENRAMTALQAPGITAYGDSVESCKFRNLKAWHIPSSVLPPGVT
jgi:hypothetical protein